MFLRMEQLPGVDNPRQYPTELIEELEKLLLSGGSASSDPKRKGFYDIESPERTFFIHISPTNGRVGLLATWHRSEDAVEHASCAEGDMQSTT